jgi:type II secretory pathway pseudopilin PulG
MTLLELLVAVALSVMLVGVLTFVWMRASDIFTTQSNRIETYRRLINIMDTIERDLANTQLTGEMEFFQDVDSNGFFSSSVDNQLASPWSPSAPNFRQAGAPGDPLLRPVPQPEFALTPAEDVLDLNGSGYIRAPTIVSPEPYLIDQTEGYLQGRAYWRDEIYVRSFITIGNHNRPALIHYRLIQPTPGGRSLLRRRVWFLDPAGQLTASTDQVDVRAVDVCDLKISFLFKPSPASGNPHVFHCAPDATSSPPGTYGALLADDLLLADARRGYVSTFSGRADPDGPSNPLQRIDPLSSKHGSYSKVVPFLYEGCARLEERALGPVALRTLTGTVSDDLTQAAFELNGTSDLARYENFDFRGVRPGAKILLYDATDDDAQQAPSATSKLAGGRFPARMWTIDSIPAEGATVLGSQGSFVSLRFSESLPFARLASSWLGPETQLQVTTPDLVAHPKAGPPRTITSSFNCHYRVGFLPSAFVARLSVDDRHNQRVIPLERVIRLLQQ